jgi:peptidoglycan/LPS O-acetylase OafA/YrhL
MAQGKSERFHGLDYLRAVAMSLGIVLHSAIALRGGLPKYGWEVHVGDRSFLLDLLVGFIHSFRIPAFYVMAGFFAYLLYSKVGLAEFIQRRTVRIVWPFFGAFAILGPVMHGVLIYGLPDAHPNYWGKLLGHFSTMNVRIYEKTWHLWFLEYLIIYLAATVLLLALFRRAMTPGVLRGIDGAFGWLIRSPLKVIILTVPTVAILYGQPNWNIEGDFTIIPGLVAPAYFALFYAFGWLLYRQRGDLHVLSRGWSIHVLIAVVVLTPVIHWLAAQVHEGPRFDPRLLALLGRGCTVLHTWLLVFGVMGFFLRHCDKPSRTARYLADAAYWLYLVHLPLVIMGRLLLEPTGVPDLLSFVIVAVCATPLLLLTYHWFVRFTWLGFVLHGWRSRH